MKNIYLLILLFLGVEASAQAPNKISYQAVLRDANGVILRNQNVRVRFSVLQTSISGTSVYQEDHQPTTNTNGLVSVYIGTGTVNSGNFSTIDWSKGPYFLQIDIDPTGGSNFTISSTSELVSVPYALYANVADSLIGGVNETDPVYDASIAKGITANDTTYWNGKLDTSSIKNFLDSSFNSNFVDLTTNQTVAGDKIFSSDLIVNGLTIGKGGDLVTTNTAIGDSALFSNIKGFASSGSYNTANGYKALYSNTSGSSNTAIGDRALYSNTTGPRNIANGDKALYSNTKGDGNVASGHKALYSNTSGSYNIAIGRDALYSNTAGSSNIANGYRALYSNTGSYNIAIGQFALQSNTTGSYNSSVGYQALNSNTTGINNTAIGRSALYHNTTGSNNTGIGIRALLSNTTGRENTAIGYSLPYNTTGSYNTASGYAALSSNTTGDYNTASGYFALGSNTTASHNIANGYKSLYSNTTGANNVATGSYALERNTIGYSNTANGYEALRFNTFGYENTGFGYRALSNNYYGKKNTAIGFYAGVANRSDSNATAIGNRATVSSSNRVRIGNTSVSRIGGQVAWTNLSDGRIKENVQEAVPGLSFISELRPVTYKINTRKQDEITMKAMPDSIKEELMLTDEEYRQSSSIVRTGFIAQEVETAAKKVGFDFDGVSTPKNENDLYGIRYAEFVVPLVKAVQEQQEMIDKQRATIEQQRNDYLLLLERIEALEDK